MTAYYRPLVQMGRDRPEAALTLADGWCWFREVAVHRRDAETVTIPVEEVPADALARLTAPRPQVAGLSMRCPQVMGILNVTPDSFSDGGKFTQSDQAVDHAMQMVGHGAAIIDIGGESTRPGADEVPITEEIARTAPVIAAIRGQSAVPISIDTRKSAVAEAAIGAGASLINDVAAFTYDPALAGVGAEAGLPVCLMHAQGSPETMQAAPCYDDVLLDVYDFLAERVSAATVQGIAADQIIIDPGIGFGKTIDHNLALLRGLSLFHGLGCPILLGASRKRFIGSIGGGQSAADRVAGSVAVALQGLRQGVQILRVHDTFETKQAFDLELAINGAGQE
jgi:dihydropteroate synthase